MRTEPIVRLSREQSRAIDRIAIDQFGMSGLVLMENAGRGCVDVMKELEINGRVAVCCGKGNNGGDGFVIARHLDLRNCGVTVFLCCQPDELQGDAATNYQILQHTGAKIVVVDARMLMSGAFQKELDSCDWIVDALLGTGARGEPRPPTDEIIQQMNRSAAKKLAVDLPSGLDCDTGKPASQTFRAAHTCTFVAEKSGFASDSATPCLGKIHVLDIGVCGQTLVKAVIDDSDA